MFLFHTYPFILPKEVIVDLTKGELKTILKGNAFDIKKNRRGTEIKAVTRSNLSVFNENGVFYAYIVFDI